MSSPDQTDPNAANFGAYAALQDALRALISTHPNKARLAQAMQHEHEHTTAFLLGAAMREQALTTYEETWQALTEPLGNS
ncbi:hypothetical protein [Chitinimonas naiadis]